MTDLLQQRKTLSQKVKDYLEKHGSKKTWLAEKLSISRPTLDQRLEDNCWTIANIIKLKEMGVDNG